MDEKMKHGCCRGAKPLQGIKCNVMNCYYHDCDTHCTAKEISVGPRNADCSAETLCATFKPREE